MKIRSAQELMKENLIVTHYAGSRSYGTELPTSDVDIRGIFCADPINVRTPFFPVRECSVPEDEDTKLYELAHFMKLCLDCNPNIIETLWVDQTDVTHHTMAYDLLRLHRQKLLSSKIAFTTSGYALSQLKRIRGHNKWLNNPQPEDPPRPYQFLSVVQWFGEDKNLKVDIPSFRDDHRLIPYGSNAYGVYSWKGYRLYDDNGNLNDKYISTDSSVEQATFTSLGPPLMVLKWNKENYQLAKERHEQYWTWRKNRNKVRGEYEEKYGYDTKHAMHLVRLLRMGVEALRDGVIQVKRPDAAELLSIRSGAWTYEQVVKYAEEMDKMVHKEWYEKTSLPKKPDIKFAAKLLMEVQDLMWTTT